LDKILGDQNEVVSMAYRFEIILLRSTPATDLPPRLLGVPGNLAIYLNPVICN
jgi:hypothetical protein